MMKMVYEKVDSLIWGEAHRFVNSVSGLAYEMETKQTSAGFRYQIK